MIKPVLVAAGDGDQRGPAPGDGAPWFANHSRDFRRAGDAVQTGGIGGEVRSPGSGSEIHSLHNAVFHFKIIKHSAEEAKVASLEKTSPGEYSLHFRLSHDNTEARLFFLFF